MLVYWIWFSLLRMNIRQKLALLEYFRDPEEIWHAQALPQLDGLEQGALEALEDKDLTAARQILDKCAEKGIGIMVFSDAAYPARLRNIADPPLVLYYKGSIPHWESQPVIGVVGTRKASAYGITTALRLGGQIAGCGGLVVSGGAFGIDTMAMQGALDAGQKTVAVLGCGVDIVYPKSNERLFAKTAENGCLISEYPPGTKPAPWQFPVRNRIISGVSNGVLVVEAPEKSGALITARDALEQGRDVYAVPGNIDVATCVGSNALLQEGAMAVFSGWDVVKQYEALYPGKVKKYTQTQVYTGERQEEKVAQTTLSPGKGMPSQLNNDKKPIDKGEKSPYSVLNNELPALTPEEQAVVACLSPEPMPVDEVIAGAKMAPGKVLTILTRLSLKGVVKNHPGKRVSK